MSVVASMIDCTTSESQRVDTKPIFPPAVFRLWRLQLRPVWPALRVLRSWSVGGKRTLRAEELAGDVEGLTSHNDDLLAVQQLLGDGAGEATEQVALAVDDLDMVLASSSSFQYRGTVGRRKSARDSSYGVATTAAIVDPGRTYNDGFECRHVARIRVCCG
jgi:hypothetical protein